jgi:hypothetical protein
MNLSTPGKCTSVAFERCFAQISAVQLISDQLIYILPPGIVLYIMYMKARALAIHYEFMFENPLRHPGFEPTG